MGGDSDLGLTGPMLYIISSWTVPCSAIRRKETDGKVAKEHKGAVHVVFVHDYLNKRSPYSQKTMVIL